MEILEEEKGNAIVLKLDGRLDASTTSNVKGKIDSVARGNLHNLVIDMGGISFIDSSGLGTLVASLRCIRKAGGDIRISSMQDQVRSIFELTRLHHLFEIYDDCEFAVDSF